ncbi:hypothetical protein [Sphingobium algorifonticola]|uniref:Uncharacterized protein n=1 Tax=Sphingobium algorifonticola TaxID=2008318 RepID=A0A437JAZ4_9SPHN|nr:hypothetical protein [Sphingobium algorifonticola]RVT43077.1 hypothetical protein ENE74_00075 [Sphingobium algorifonticola]
MTTFGQIMPYGYMLLFIVIGWRLYVLRWDWRWKAASGAAMVIAPPLLFLLPALRNPQGSFAGWLLAMGIGMLVAGALCLGGGVLAAWLRARPRTP